MSVFADTFYWVALLNRRDSANRAVLEFSRGSRFRLIVTFNFRRQNLHVKSL